ncbi:MAG TPA: 3-hydroxyacyl-CoA dehydrogenase NAD-binding domain-containing protein [Thermodesulfobacteriota bacterium]|nr:3-hydroxyacyl-CoA dehydrogenase NAD-binding domain-containing protein [Thermodesulfobacteriota bacterium]
MKVRDQINRIGVVGCGQMGSGYAQLCAQRGYQVIVTDESEELLKKGLSTIDSRLTESGDQDLILSRIEGTTGFKRFVECDLVIEAATEKMEVKKKIFAELDRVCPKDVVLATNTSVLSVLDIAVATQRPDRILGIHMNPLLFPSAEIIHTLLTGQEALEVAKRFSESLGKAIIIAKDTPGFLVNRLLTPLLLEAIRMLEAGTATRDEIDGAFTKGMGWPMGPLAMVDGIGLDTVLFGTDAIYEDLKIPLFIAPLLLKKMVTAGWLGMKTGKGFYEYGK